MGSGSTAFGSDPVRLSLLLDSLGCGLYTVDADGVLTGINREGAALLGYTSEELVGQQAHATLHAQRPDGSPYPREQCPLLGVLTDGRRAEAEVDAFVDSTGDLLPVSWISTPLLEAGRTVGAVVLFRSVAAREQVERQRTHALQAERAQRGLVDAAHERLRLLAATSQALSSTLDMDEALRRLTRLVVPRLADCCVIDTVDDDGQLRRVALAHRDAGRASAVEHEQPLPPPAGSQAPLARVLSGAPTLRVDLSEEGSTGAQGADRLRELQSRLFSDLGARHAIIAPLAARGEVLGALTLLQARENAAFSDADVELVGEVARRAAMALDFLRLHAGQRNVAETLQRSLLTLLATVDHIPVAARYLPAGKHNRVGGDWYDAFLLTDGCTALIIGDIAGHDLDAAARMGQVRNVLRGIAIDRTDPPSEIVRRLDLAVDHLGAASYATLVLAKVELVDEATNARQLRYTNAGHPPPLLVHADGQVDVLDAAPDLPLGVLPSEQRTDVEVALPPGSTVLLYTDGVIEHREEDLTAGLARLRNAAAQHAREPVEQFCDGVLAALGLPGDTVDDIALLALRVPLPEDDATGRGHGSR